MFSCCSGFVGLCFSTSETPFCSWRRSLLERGGVSQTHSLGADSSRICCLQLTGLFSLNLIFSFSFLSPFVRPQNWRRRKMKLWPCGSSLRASPRSMTACWRSTRSWWSAPQPLGRPVCLARPGSKLAAVSPSSLISFSAAPASASLGPNSQNPSLGRRSGLVDGSHLARWPWSPGQPFALWAFPASCPASVPLRRGPFLPCTPGAQFGAP